MQYVESCASRFRLAVITLSLWRWRGWCIRGETAARDSLVTATSSQSRNRVMLKRCRANQLSSEAIDSLMCRLWVELDLQLEIQLLQLTEKWRNILYCFTICIALYQFTKFSQVVLGPWLTRSDKGKMLIKQNGDSLNEVGYKCRKHVCWRRIKCELIRVFQTNRVSGWIEVIIICLHLMFAVYYNSVTIP